MEEFEKNKYHIRGKVVPKKTSQPNCNRDLLTWDESERLGVMWKNSNQDH